MGCRRKYLITWLPNDFLFQYSWTKMNRIHLFKTCFIIQAILDSVNWYLDEYSYCLDMETLGLEILSAWFLVVTYLTSTDLRPFLCSTAAAHDTRICDTTATLNLPGIHKYIWHGYFLQQQQGWKITSGTCFSVNFLADLLIVPVDLLTNTAYYVTVHFGMLTSWTKHTWIRDWHIECTPYWMLMSTALI